MIFLNAWKDDGQEKRTAQELLSMSEEEVSHRFQSLYPY